MAQTATARLALWLGVLLFVGTVAAPRADALRQWRATGSLNTARADHTATLLTDGKVLVAGGRVGLGAETASAELYDPATGRWSSVGSMHFPRAGHTATLLTGPGCAPSCGKVLVVGGTTAAQAELFDPLTRTWSLAGALTTARSGHTASLLYGPACDGATPPGWCGKVLVAGGQGATAPAMPLTGAELYDPAGDKWTATGDLGAARRDHTATLLGDGRVLVVGGRSDGALYSTELYDPQSGTWAPAGELVVARYVHSATRLPDGRVLVVGGLDSSGNARRSAELYDPTVAGGSWLPAASMTYGRGRHTATLLADGAVLVTGGGYSGADLPFSELYAGSPASWTLAESLATSRQDQTATLLSGPGCSPRCGDVLVAGGLRQVSTFLRSSELFGDFPGVTSAAPATSVTDLSARALSSRRIALSFSAPTAGGQPVRRYVVKQSREPVTEASFASAHSLCGGTCSFASAARVTLMVEDLVPNRLYHYALRPLDSAGRPGKLSNPAQARTDKDRIRPGRVRGLSARALGRRLIRLRFRAPASDGRAGPPVRRYMIKQSTRPVTGVRSFSKARSLCPGGCRFAPSRVGARLTLRISRLCAGRRFYYAIRAKDEAGNLSPLSRFRAVRAPGPRGRRC